MVTIGRVNKIPISGYDIEWQIPGFSLSSTEYSSPIFSFADALWSLKLYLNRHKVARTSYMKWMARFDHVALCLRKNSSGPPINLEFSLSFKTEDGEKEPVIHCTNIFKETDTDFEVPFEQITAYSLAEGNDSLTVVCTLKYPESIEDPNVASLHQDYKKVLLEGQSHNLTLKVGDKELRAHQDILKARSRVFESMLSHDMMEKNSGVIDMPDCDPQAAELFLSYMYCGKVEMLNESNVFGLYYVADKYDKEDLKGKCREFIQNSLSPTNTCKILLLALSHSDTGLLECATDYFGNNMKYIMRTAEWQSFLKDNFTLGNELVIKSIKKLKATFDMNNFCLFIQKKQNQ